MKQIAPPPWLELLLRFLLPVRDRETIAGDLYEEFCDRSASGHSSLRAIVWYFLQAISFAPRKLRSTLMTPRVLASFSALALLYGCWLGAVKYRLLHFGHLSQPSGELHSAFAGKWILPFDGKPFVTLILTPSTSGYTGSATNGNLQLSAEGRILHVKTQAGSSPISSTQETGQELRIHMLDGNDTVTWKMVLKDSTHADLTLLVPGFQKVESFQAVKAA